jgi:hypothetical protein
LVTSFIPPWLPRAPCPVISTQSVRHQD